MNENLLNFENTQRIVMSDLQDQLDDHLPFENIKSKDAPRALQTYFRSSFRVQMTMITLADRKANIMLRLNSLLITVMVIFFKNIIEYDSATILTIVIFFVTLLVSLIYATLATKPSQDIFEKIDFSDSSDAADQMFFFSRFAQMDKELFDKGFDLMMRDTGKIYKNMAHGLYDISGLLMIKYRMLNISYTVFLGGLILTVVSLIAVLLM